MDDNCFRTSVCGWTQEFGQSYASYFQATKLIKNNQLLSYLLKLHRKEDTTVTSESRNPFSSVSISNLALDFPPAASSTKASLHMYIPTDF